MSIYTYRINKNLCEIFNTEYFERPDVSDQELNKIAEDAILGGTDYVSGMIWITNGKENSYIDPKETIPEGWRKGKTMDHMSNRDPGKWRDLCKQSANKQWENNIERKKLFSTKMKGVWQNNYDHMAENARKNGKHGMFGKLNPRALLLEYKGVEYYGWRELKEATGVTKDLYKKYYLNGVDPEPRIGKDGPSSTLLLEYKGIQYCGWKQLKEKTGVTKDLYKNHYLNGIDPEPRIGKTGRISSKTFSSTSTVVKDHQGGSA